MKYYVLKINGDFVRKSHIEQTSDYDVDMYCKHTDDINLAEKFTEREVLDKTGDVKYLDMYLNAFDHVDGVTVIGDWNFVGVDL